MKTAVTVLQEMMVKMAKIPEYECIAQSGPQHQASFEYQCSALGVVVTAGARSKKEAKQEVARLMLRQLAERGHPVPPPYGLHDPQPDTQAKRRKYEDFTHKQQNNKDTSDHSSDGLLRTIRRASPPLEATGGVKPASVEGGGAGGGVAVGAHSYVALLQELCAEYGLAGPQYALVADTGPPHLRHFTMEARVARLTRSATHTTKKAARQLAAEALYTHLRGNLAKLTADFVEEEALVRAHERAMERYTELRDDTRRPDLGQKIADYHLGLTYRIDVESRQAALRCLEQGGDPVDAVTSALGALGLRAEGGWLPADGARLHVLAVPAASPPLAFAGASAAAAADDAARYLRRALTRPQHTPTALTPPTQPCTL